VPPDSDHAVATGATGIGLVDATYTLADAVVA
jgi:hypothetical protein